MRCRCKKLVKVWFKDSLLSFNETNEYVFHLLAPHINFLYTTYPTIMAMKLLVPRIMAGMYKDLFLYLPSFAPKYFRQDCSTVTKKTRQFFCHTNLIVLVYIDYPENSWSTVLIRYLLLFFLFRPCDKFIPYIAELESSKSVMFVCILQKMLKS